MTISLIAAVGRNYELGKNGELICRLKGDLPFFKRVTIGKPVIMGRKTFESLPAALPGRLNIVITSNALYPADGITVVSSAEKALETAERTGSAEAFVIGGGTVYSEYLPLADKLYLTEADFSDSDADTFFPRFDKSEWTREVIDVFDGEIPYEHVLYTRKNNK